MPNWGRTDVMPKTFSFCFLNIIYYSISYIVDIAISIIYLYIHMHMHIYTQICTHMESPNINIGR